MGMIKVATAFVAAVVATPLLAAVMLASSSTHADAWPRTVRIYCKSDYQRFCPKYKVGTPQMTACMRSNANHLSPVCKKALIDSGVARRYGY